MSLNIRQKDDIRKIRLGWFYAINENGEPMYPSQHEEKPNYEVGELRNMIFDTLKQKGFEIFRVKPAAANCIIRVYKEEKEYNDGTVYRILGAHCYTKNSDGRWKCIDRLGEEYGIDFSKHMLRTWFFQDEYWDVSLDFFDTYVKLVKEN